MAEKITGKFIIDAVSNCIGKNFEKATIYTEKKKQGMKTPCFFVFETSVSQSKKLKGTLERVYNITVRWVPNDESKRKYEDCAKTGNQLSEILALINTGETPTHGTDIQYEIIDDVLHCYVNYKVRMTKEKEPQPIMEEAEIETNYKEG